jgi:transcription elongation factor Elf1
MSSYDNWRTGLNVIRCKQCGVEHFESEEHECVSQVDIDLDAVDEWYDHSRRV